MHINKISLLFLFVLFFFSISSYAQNIDNHEQPEKINFISGKVLEIISDTTQTQHQHTTRTQFIKVKLENKKIIETVNEINPELTYQLILKNGDSILLHEEEGAYFVDAHKIDHIAWILFGIFLLLILLIGGQKGVFTIISLLIKGTLLILFFIPTLKSGFSPVILTIFFCILTTIFTITLVSGINYKTLSACLGAIGGVIVAGLLAIWAVKASYLNGLLETEYQAIFYQFPKISLQELITSGVLIGSLGATMDVSISVASSLYEVHIAAPHKKFHELCLVGMNVGRDVMGTMVNTLILAYIGSSIATVVLLSEMNISFLLNTEILMREVILAIAGSIGLILTIPITSLISSYFYTK